MKSFLSVINESKNTITVFHGTIEKHLRDIKRKGLEDKQSSPTWYMVSTDIESAIFHCNVDDSNCEYSPIVIEFEVPIAEEPWYGYPHFWKPYNRDNKSVWFSLNGDLPKKFITKVHKIKYDKYLKIKDTWK